MTTKDTRSKVLIVDDVPDYLVAKRELLERDGHSVDTARSAAEALQRLDSESWDLVVLDQRLEGNAGPDSGLDVLDEIRSRSPHTKVIMATGFAAPEAVERAFARGAFDYLEKNGIFDAVLRIKALQAVEAARERRVASLANGAREQAIRDTWQRVLTETDRNAKGAHLETFIELLFRSMPGFEETTPDHQSRDEQIDIYITNRSNDPTFQHEGTYFLAECKNWSKPAGADEGDMILAQMRRKRGRAKLGFFVAPQDVTAGFHSRIDSAREGDMLVIVLDKVALEELIATSDRVAVLRRLHKQATVRSQ